MAFHGVNDTADRGDDITKAKVESVSALVVKTKIMNVADGGSSGITLLIDYTKHDESSITLAASLNVPAIGTDNFKIPLLASGSLSELTITLSASGHWAWPIALPAITAGYLVITVTATSADDETIITIDAIRDSINGR
jgi:hypothetical protein